MIPKLRFSEQQIANIAARYEYYQEDTLLLQLRPNIRERGWMRKDELRKVAKWKAPRSAARVEANSEQYIKEITHFAFCASTERARIEVLTALDGVLWPTASVILHFFHREPYPILDYRALWSVSLQVPTQYNFKFWWNYVQFCRDIAKRNGIDMRTVDKALWQYSKNKRKK